MTDDGVDLSDEWLGAYVDGELTPADRERMEALLGRDPDARRRLAAIREVTLLVRAATHTGTPGVDEDRQPASFARERKPAWRRPAWLDWRLAASFAAGALVLFAALELGGRFAYAPADWHDSALAFHDMYVRARSNAPKDTMLDIFEHQPAQLAELISFEPFIPDLAEHGYRPAGAHLISGPEGPVVYVVFESDERPPIGFAMTRSSGANAAAGAAAHPAVHSTRNGVTLVSWSGDGFDYGVGGQLPDGDLMFLADAAQRSLSASSR